MDLIRIHMMLASNVIQMSERNSPQVENGYTKLANELLDAMVYSGFSKREWAVFMAIVRKTYGYNKKEDFISGWQIADMTGIDRAHISKTINEMVDKRILLRSNSCRISHGKEVFGLSINKHYQEWKTVAVLDTVAETAPLLKQHSTVAVLATETVAVLATPPLLKQPTQKTTPKDNKEKPKERRASEKTSLAVYLQKCKEKHKKPIPENDKVFDWAEESGVPLEFLRLAWLYFRDEFLDRDDKKQASWPQTFRNYVKKDYLNLWYQKDGVAYLTNPVGVQAMARFKGEL